MSEFAVGEPFPRKQTIFWFQQAAYVTLPIINLSPGRARFRLSGADPEGACHFEFLLPGHTGYLTRQAELWLSPEEAVAVPVRITPPAGPVVGLGKAVHHFTITATMLSAAPASRSVLGEVAGKPLVGPGLVGLAAACLLAVLFFAAQFFVPAAVVYRQAQAQPAGPSRLSVNDIAAVLSNLDEVDSAPGAAGDVAKNRAEMTHEEIFQEIAPQYGLDWHLLAEIAYQESRMDPWALGRDNDMGLMQIIPSTWNEWAPKVGVTDPYDPYSNVLVAAAYLAYIREYAGARGYTEDYWMLVGYNWGPNNLRQLFNDTQMRIPDRQDRYARDILRARANGLARWRR